MARETKAERIARQEKEAQEHMAKLNAEYFPKLMVVLEKITTYGGEIRVKEGKFNVLFQHEEYDISPSYSGARYYVWCNSLESLEYAIRDHEAILAEIERKSKLRSEALAKLTPEEAEALGVSKF